MREKSWRIADDITIEKCAQPMGTLLMTYIRGTGSKQANCIENVVECWEDRKPETIDVNDCAMQEQRKHMPRGLRMTEAELQAYYRQQGEDCRVAAPRPVLETYRKSPYWPYRSKTEQRYATVLEEEKQTGIIRAWWYEPIKGLYLAPKTSYTPDFLIELPCYGPGNTGLLAFHEVKGAFIREKDWIKVKLAARLYPCFHFLLVQWKDDTWRWQEVPPC